LKDKVKKQLQLYSDIDWIFINASKQLGDYLLEIGVEFAMIVTVELKSELNKL